MSIINDQTAWGGWSLGPIGARLVDGALKLRRPKYILEAGSGVSTVMLAEHVRSQRGHRPLVVSLESDAEYFEQTRAMLRTRGLRKNVDLRLVPLTTYGTPFGQTWWYDNRDISPGIDFALIDGPPGHRSGGRAATLAALWDLLVPTFELWLDDAHRPQERHAVRSWATRYGVNVEMVEAGRKQMARVTR